MASFSSLCNKWFSTCNIRMTARAGMSQECPFCCQFHCLLVWACPHAHTWAAHTQRGGQRGKQRHGWGCLWANVSEPRAKGYVYVIVIPSSHCCRVQAHLPKLKENATGCSREGQSRFLQDRTTYLPLKQSICLPRCFLLVAIQTDVK